MQGSCLQSKALAAGDCTFCCWRLGYLGNLFLAGFLLQWRANLYLLPLCFEMAVLRKNTWQECFQSWNPGSDFTLILVPGVWVSDDEMLMVLGVSWRDWKVISITAPQSCRLSWKGGRLLLLLNSWNRPAGKVTCLSGVCRELCSIWFAIEHQATRW